MKDIRSRLKAAADPEFEAGLRWFFKEPVKPYGVRTPLLRELARLAYAQVKHWPVAERDRFVTELWKSGMLEEGVIVSHLYRRFAKILRRARIRDVRAVDRSLRSELVELRWRLHLADRGVDRQSSRLGGPAGRAGRNPRIAGSGDRRRCR